MPIDVKSDDMGDVIKDFYKSDAPQFKGKSKKKRRQMAIAAKLSANESFDSNYDRSDREEREFRQRDLRMKHGKNWKEFTKDAKMGDSLRPGEVKRYDKKLGKWVSNKD